MAFIDYYKILGVDKNIPQKDVRAAYRKRAKQFHPDLHPNDPKAKAKFQALSEAYEVIGDPDKRAKYDKYGENWQQADAYEKQGGGGFHWGGGSPFEGLASAVSLRSCLVARQAHNARLAALVLIGARAVSTAVRAQAR